MFLRSDKRRLMIAMAIVVAFVAVVVPTCRMVGCSMQMKGYMGFMHGGAELGFFSDCGGQIVSSEVPFALGSSSLETMALAFVAMLVAFLMTRQTPVVQRITVHNSDPPLLPTEPRGERFRV